jgi:hypothetical protein
MPSHRGHQKKLEKKKKKRLAVQQGARAVAAVPAQKAIERLAAASPFGPAFMSVGWRSTEEGDPPLVSLLLSRALSDGTFVVTMCLVDRTCLGIKNAYVTPAITRAGLDDMVDRLQEAHTDGVEEVSVLEAQSVLFNGLDYAASLGFGPHRDFVSALVEPRPDTLLDTPLARPSRPIYVPGPDDDVARVVRALQAKVGTGYSLGGLTGGLDVSELLKNA